MSLNDLVHHIPEPDQLRRINDLINIPNSFFTKDSPKTSLTEWDEFKMSLWGKDIVTESVRQDDGTVYTIVDIPKTAPLTLSAYTSRILVRAEYVEALRAALEVNARDIQAFMVTGQPGIGPSPPISSSTELNL